MRRIIIEDGDHSRLDVGTTTEKPLRVLLLNDEADNLLRLSRVLEEFGCSAVTVSCISEAEASFFSIDAALLHYQLASGTLGTEVVQKLRAKRPELPIIILSATLKSQSLGPEHMQLLKGQSSTESLVEALSSLRSTQQRPPAVINSRNVFYSRIDIAMGSEVVLMIFNSDGDWQYVNETCAQLLEHPRDWFQSRNMFRELSGLNPEWLGVIRTVAEMRETYIDRSYHGMLNLPSKGDEWVWSVLAFPINLHNGESGVALIARTLERKR